MPHFVFELMHGHLSIANGLGDDLDNLRFPYPATVLTAHGTRNQLRNVPKSVEIKQNKINMAITQAFDCGSAWGVLVRYPSVSVSVRQQQSF